MGSFGWAKYIATVLLIGVAAGGLMWVYDLLAQPFNTQANTMGTTSHIGVQAMTILYWGIVAYAPINLIFASVEALLVANARAETNSPFITTNAGHHIVLAVTIIASELFCVIAAAFMDPFLLALPVVDFAGTAGTLNSMHAAVFVLAAVAVGVMYLYVALDSINKESQQWPGGMVG